MKPKRIGSKANVSSMFDYDDRNVIIDDVIDKFNFEKVHVAMVALDWGWHTTEGNGLAVPSVAKLKACARHLLREAINHKCVATGGFVARYLPKVDDEPEQFTLQFIVESIDSDGHD